jgi:hypothetical protein
MTGLALGAWENAAGYVPTPPFSSLNPAVHHN